MSLGGMFGHGSVANGRLTASGLVPAPALAHSHTVRCTAPVRPPAREARTARLDHALQPRLQGRTGRRVHGRRAAKREGVVGGQERAAGESTAEEGRDGSCRAAEARGEGQGRAANGLSAALCCRVLDGRGHLLGGLELLTVRGLDG
jgi:hypothetical protein